MYRSRIFTRPTVHICQRRNGIRVTTRIAARVLASVDAPYKIQSGGTDDGANSGYESLKKKILV